MNYLLISVPLALCLMGGMLLALEFGRRLGRRRATQLDSSNTGALDSAVFALLGLLLAFTFSGAAARFDARRAQAVEEANDIGTAWLRLDLLPPERQPPLRDLFRRYVDARLEMYERLQNIEVQAPDLSHTETIQTEIWQRATAACRERNDSATTSLMLSSLNTMFDITTSRVAAGLMHPPLILYVLLFVLALASALVAGHSMASAKVAPWLHMVTFTTVIAASIFLVLDLEYPRAGVIRIDQIDALLANVRAGMR
ncbi:MAG: DUF4239 domain-containing protein [Pseudomonadota bacterium]